MRQFKRTPTLLPITEFAILPITECRRFLLLIPRICLPTEPMLNELGCYLLTVWDPRNTENRRSRQRRNCLSISYTRSASLRKQRRNIRYLVHSRMRQSYLLGIFIPIVRAEIVNKQRKLKKYWQLSDLDYIVKRSLNHVAKKRFFNRNEEVETMSKMFLSLLGLLLLEAAYSTSILQY